MRFYQTVLVVLLNVSFVLYAQEPVVGLAELQKQAQEGDAYAQLNLGAFYDHGLKLEPDLDKAEYWYSQAALQGVPEAQFNLAHLLYTERSDYQQAAQWMEKAAKQGVVEASYLLGLMYKDGIGVIQDEARMLHWLNYAAGAKHPAAVEELVHYRGGQ